MYARTEFVRMPLRCPLRCMWGYDNIFCSGRVKSFSFGSPGVLGCVVRCRDVFTGIAGRRVLRLRVCFVGGADIPRGIVLCE